MIGRGPRARTPAPARHRVVGLAAIAYRRRATALHAARAPVGLAYCAALGALALTVTHPIVLAAVLATTLLAGARVGALRAQRRSLLVAIPLALVLLVAQTLLDRHGLTVVARLGTVPGLGALDITAEALAAAGTLALRLVTIVLVGILTVTAVNPDALLMAARRRWPAGALTAALALRIVPVLARDGQRMADARRCRPAGVPGAIGDGERLLVLRTVTASVLDRASDLSATLELRGHGLAATARRRPRRPSAPRASVHPHGSGDRGLPHPARPLRPGRRPGGGDGVPWSRHDRSLLLAALALVALGVYGLATGAATMPTNPTIQLRLGLGSWALVALVPAVALAPLLDRRGVAVA